MLAGLPQQRYTARDQCVIDYLIERRIEVMDTDIEVPSRCPTLDYYTTNYGMSFALFIVPDNDAVAETASATACSYMLHLLLHSYIRK